MHSGRTASLSGSPATAWRIPAASSSPCRKMTSIFQRTFMDACALAGIETRQLDPREALRLEPNVNPALIGAIQVPTARSILSAWPPPTCWTRKNTAPASSPTARCGLLRTQDRVHGSGAINTRTGEAFEVECREVINAAGIWGQQICEYARPWHPHVPGQGSCSSWDYRPQPAGAQPLPQAGGCGHSGAGRHHLLIGTTSSRIDYDKIDQLTARAQRGGGAAARGDQLAPVMARTRLLRAYAGCTPLAAVDGDESGRNISRGIVLLDRVERDGLQGFNTITGGKLMTYRLMAEWATDLLARKLGNSKPCRTAELVPCRACGIRRRSQPLVSVPAEGSAQYRHGERVIAFFRDNPKANALICECEMVTAGRLNTPCASLDVDTTWWTGAAAPRLGMGPRQGSCAPIAPPA